MTTVEPMNARVWSSDDMARLFADGWPRFIGADREVKRYLPRVREFFSDLELGLIDSDGVLVASGWAVPIAWSGAVEDLPAGYTDSMARAVANHGQDRESDTLVVMAAQVHPERRGRGLAPELLSAMYRLAEQRGWRRVIAPVRPILKVRYPLTPIDRFASWTRADGSPLDPWVRAHWRLGAQMIATVACSQTMTGTVSEWESWTELALPESGDYVVPDGMSVLHVDRDADRGTYVEPGIWLRHR